MCVSYAELRNNGLRVHFDKIQDSFYNYDCDDVAFCCTTMDSSLKMIAFIDGVKDQDVYI
jgi:hypothetical protein